MTPDYIPQQEAPQERGRRAHRVATLIVLFLAVAGGSGGTWAAFTASTSNSASFATGLLILTNQKNELDTCFSTDENTAITDNVGACDKLFELGAVAPGEEDEVAITIGNDGNIDASALELYASEACETEPVGTHYGNDTDICDDIELMIQQYPSEAHQDDLDADGGTCVYGVDAVVDGECDGFDSTRNLAHFAATFSGHAAAIDLGSLAPADTRWFRIFIRLSPSAQNEQQGLGATFGLHWRAVQ